MATIRRKNGGWQALIRRKGHSSVAKTFPKKILAEAWARKKEEELATKLHINSRAAETTVGEIMDKYLRQITPRKRSADVEKFRIQTVSKHFGEFALEELSPNSIIDFVDERREEVSSDSIRKELGVLSQAIDASMALWGIELPANPVHTARNILKVTKTLEPGRKRSRRPTDEELEILYDSLPGLMPRLVEFAIETGMRRGEIANQETDHRVGTTLRIPETKTDTPRTIPLSQRAGEILDSLDGTEDQSVWGMTPRNISQKFTRTCARVGIENLRFHDLRHEAASRFFERGLSVAEVAAITGQTFETLQRYTHLKPEDIATKLTN